MSDRRLTPANGRVAARALQGRVTADRFTDGEAATVVAPVTDLCAAPGGPRDRQLLMGAAITVYDRHAGWAFVQAEADGYVGHIAETALGPATTPTHAIASRATHAYAAPDIKTPDRAWLPLGARLAVTGEDGRFAQTPLGFVPRAHLCALDTPEPDPVAVAERLLGTPYLWGGNSPLGIDCSGLVQIALAACGRPCPGDSDLQEAALGHTVAPGTPPRRGDLLFWKGHVAWVADARTLLHANAHHMAAVLEPAEAAIARIDRQGDGRPTRHARLEA